MAINADDNSPLGTYRGTTTHYLIFLPLLLTAEIPSIEVSPLLSGAVRHRKYHRHRLSRCRPHWKVARFTWGTTAIWLFHKDFNMVSCRVVRRGCARSDRKTSPGAGSGPTSGTAFHLVHSSKQSSQYRSYVEQLGGTLFKFGRKRKSLHSKCAIPCFVRIRWRASTAEGSKRFTAK
ncbi:hypothetical protein BDP27DRAFT_816545 [Rhodocollybia butyracea]|uniref:Uncharacterized protein n=1 Tax=Rhodocollybia butyracea TaxID=206335 RepID=A0A9P5PSB9_9AGAR|nr:hypothetical protein BDP27DRAFT_816545 [Rhodocollybia butyracea]